MADFKRNSDKGLIKSKFIEHRIFKLKIFLFIERTICHRISAFIGYRCLKQNELNHEMYAISIRYLPH